MNFQSRFVKSTKSKLIYIITAKADGKPAWYYVQVDEPKHKAFKKQMETGSMDLSAYGKILRSGWGESPPKAVADMMEKSISQED